MRPKTAVWAVRQAPTATPWATVAMPGRHQEGAERALAQTVATHGDGQHRDQVGDGDDHARVGQGDMVDTDRPHVTPLAGHGAAPKQAPPQRRRRSALP